MLLRAYVSEKKCKKKATFEKMQLGSDSQYLSERANIERELLRCIAQKMSRREIEERLKYRLQAYKAEWFELPIVENIRHRDYQILERFLNWFYRDRLPVYKEIKSNCKIPLENGLESLIGLLCQRENGKVDAYLFRNHTFLSEKARRDENRIEYDLELLYAKKALLQRGCDGEVYLIAWFNGDDKLYTVTDFHTLGCQDNGSNLFCLPVNKDEIDAYLQYAETVDRKEACRNCQYRQICRLPSFSESYGEATMRRLDQSGTDKSKSTYQLPVFSERQKMAISQTEGALRLTCGPGSGKTATLVGRTVYMIEKKHIPAQNILLIAFSRKAENELEVRLKSVLGDQQQPTVKTVHALGYDILRSNRKVLGYRPKLMTDSTAYKLLDDILTERFASGKELDGMNVINMYGSYGLVRQFFWLYQEFCTIDEKCFREKYQSRMDLEQFREVAKTYQAKIREEGYITYEEQITLAIDLLQQNPKICAMYRQMYRYVMVDEYQDTNNQTAALLSLLVPTDGNICVVGDDDQSIYGFRGGSNAFLMRFEEQYPSARTITLGTNYRSTTAIVRAANRLIRVESERLPKDLEAIREGEPIHFHANSKVEDLERIIQTARAAGYQYNEIAILAIENDTLEQLHESLTVPTLLAKAFLRTDPAFLYIYSVLDLFYNGLGRETNESFYRLVALFSEENALKLVPADGKSLYQGALQSKRHKDVRDHSYWDNLQMSEQDVLTGVLALLSDAFRICEIGATTGTTLQRLLELIGIENHIMMDEISDMIQNDRKKAAELPDFYELAKEILRYADGRRLSTQNANAVTLATCHDCKGLEWPVVILWQVEDFSVRGNVSKLTEKAYDELREKRRLLYVSMTRAKDVLYLMQKKSDVGRVSLLGEIHAAISGEGSADMEGEG